MAKAKKENGASRKVNRHVPEGVVVPSGYQKQSTDIVGFWDQESSPAIHFIPLEAKVFDSQLDKSKPSTLVIGKLVDACALTTSDDEAITGQPGELIGVWFKPGMAALKDLAGVKVFMYGTGEIDTGKPNPMKTYDVHSTGKGNRLVVTDDKRDKSRGVNTLLTGAKGDAKANAASPPNQGDDDIPF
jgi:hypothetical protein